jgi:hypothetical protein
LVAALDALESVLNGLAEVEQLLLLAAVKVHACAHPAGNYATRTSDLHCLL